MIVDQLATGLHGGAAIAARRLHELLCAVGVASRFWYSHRVRMDPPDSSYQALRWDRHSRNPFAVACTKLVGRVRRCRYKAELRRALRGRPPGLEIFTHARTGWLTPFDPHQLSGDILHLHWVAGLIDYPSFFASIPDDHPIVWTLHDMNPFTGGCHYSSGCRSFTTVCKRCPQLGVHEDRDLANRCFHLKHRAVRGKNLHIAAPSQWLCDAAQRSRILSDARSFHRIPYGLDTERLAPQDKRRARFELGLPPDCVIVGFGADRLDCIRKGGCQLVMALKRLPRSPSILCITFGGGNLPSDDELPMIKSLGYMHDLGRLALAYSAMDLFVMPSLEDNLPQTGLEAMACGTPVVAFRTGGVPEYVRPFETGLLATVGDAAELSACIEWLVTRPEQMHRMGQEARRMIEREYSLHRQADAYVELYRCLLEERRAGVERSLSAA